MIEDVHTDVTIRKAAQSDAEALVDFIEPFVEQGVLLRRTLSEMKDLLDNFFLAEYEGDIVGCAALEIYNRKLCEIRSLAVSPRVQGMGVGKKLVAACIDRAREQQVYEIMAISSSENFFLACGFNFTLPHERKAFFMQTRDEP